MSYLAQYIQNIIISTCDQSNENGIVIFYIIFS